MELSEILPCLKSGTCAWTAGKKGFIKYCW